MPEIISLGDRLYNFMSRYIDRAMLLGQKKKRLVSFSLRSLVRTSKRRFHKKSKSNKEFISRYLGEL